MSEGRISQVQSSIPTSQSTEIVVGHSQANIIQIHERNSIAASLSKSKMPSKVVNIEEGWEKIVEFEEYRKKESVRDSSEKTQIIYYLHLFQTSNSFTICKALLTSFPEQNLFKWTIQYLFKESDGVFLDSLVSYNKKSISSVGMNKYQPLSLSHFSQLFLSYELFQCQSTTNADNSVVELERFSFFAKYLQLFSGFAYFVNKGGHFYAENLFMKLKSYLNNQLVMRNAKDWFQLFFGLPEVASTDSASKLLQPVYNLFENEINLLQKELNSKCPVMLTKKEETDRKSTLAKMMGFDDDSDSDSSSSDFSAGPSKQVEHVEDTTRMEIEADHLEDELISTLGKRNHEFSEKNTQEDEEDSEDIDDNDEDESESEKNIFEEQLTSLVETPKAGSIRMDP
jgi:hypothetical protein